MEVRTPEITWQFNAKLAALLLFALMLNVPFEPDFPPVPFDAFLAKYPVFGWFTFGMIGVALLVVSVKVLSEVWSKLVTNVFEVREITVQEAVTCVLILGFLGTC